MRALRRHSLKKYSNKILRICKDAKTLFKIIFISKKLVYHTLSIIFFYSYLRLPQMI